MAAKIKHGIVLYDLEMNGCLNGVYTNEDSVVDGTIFNEIARNQDPNTEVYFPGIYHCLYFDEGNERVEARLEVNRMPGRQRTFLFSWFRSSDDRLLFTGTGYQMNSGQVAVHYQSAL